MSIPQIRALSDSEAEEDVTGNEEPVERENGAPEAAKLLLSELESGTSAAQNSNPPKLRKKKKRKDPPLPEPCSAADVLYKEIRNLLGGDVVDAVTEAGGAFQSPFSYGHEAVLKIETIGSGGSGIGLAPTEKGPWAIVVPVALTGETVRVRIVKNDRMHSYGQLQELLKPNTELRDDSRVQCKYFGSCGGCQYQMLSGETQLDLKRDVIVKAYKTYSSLPESSIPPIEATVESPLVYNYRTKITPHFERPPKSAKKEDVPCGQQPSWLKIGFNVANSNSTLDIELSDAFTKHVCVSNQNGTSREMVGDYLFEYTAGGFFQNNNSVLPLMVNFVRDLINPGEGKEHPTHLVDTYCGAGLFAISLSSVFEKVAGIELSKSSIESAKKNARLNAISEDRISFLSGEASNIFATVKDFPKERTVVIIDPPRKGCDDLFLEQLLNFRCSTVVYVSCNVHTQARDIGYIVRSTENDGEGKRYRMESLRGFDLFPQTAHVESVALLRLY
ncbi:S-adenosyl-L-methionine-dependent methyltransferase [Flammula alnicola]|nr:S-adenosyl-L-methionine-dependent methyltransferase [Flammula alnicola]